VRDDGGVEAGGVGPEQHPDYRFTLANERTFLAWVRTGLALDAAGLAVLHLLPELLVPGVREALGLAMVALAVFVTVAGHRRWQDHQAALERSEPLPETRLPGVLVTSLVALSVLTALLVVAEQWS
jgi:putative membrane protein